MSLLLGVRPTVQQRRIPSARRQLHVLVLQFGTQRDRWYTPCAAGRFPATEVVAPEGPRSARSLAGVLLGERASIWPSACQWAVIRPRSRACPRPAQGRSSAPPPASRSRSGPYPARRSSHRSPARVAVPCTQRPEKGRRPSPRCQMTTVVRGPIRPLACPAPARSNSRGMPSIVDAICPTGTLTAPGTCPLA